MRRGRIQQFGVVVLERRGRNGWVVSSAYLSMICDRNRGSRVGS